MQHLRSKEAQQRRQQRFESYTLYKQQRNVARVIIRRYQYVDNHKVRGEKVYTLLTHQKLYNALASQFEYVLPNVANHCECGEVLNASCNFEEWI